MTHKSTMMVKGNSKKMTQRQTKFNVKKVKLARTGIYFVILSFKVKLRDFKDSLETNFPC